MTKIKGVDITQRWQKMLHRTDFVRGRFNPVDIIRWDEKQGVYWVSFFHWAPMITDTSKSKPQITGTTYNQKWSGRRRNTYHLSFGHWEITFLTLSDPKNAPLLLRWLLAIMLGYIFGRRDRNA